VDADTLTVMHLLDEEYTECPFYGSRRLREALRKRNHEVGRRQIRRLMRVLGIQALYPKPRTTVPHPGHKVYPYLLRGVKVTRPNQVWSTDITYVRMPHGFIYLTAVLDWYSRYVLSWEVSVTIEGSFCLSALRRALRAGTPEIFNTDQGSQYTSSEFTGTLEENGIAVSMDGRGRALDNVFVERLWRSVKWEHVYVCPYDTVTERVAGLRDYFGFYNEKRPHQSLGYRTPASVYFGV
jgi:putative transposase